MGITRLLGLLCCGLIMVGCVRSINPVLKDDQVGQYPQIAGSWVSTEDKSHFEAVADDNAFKISFVDENGKPGDFVVRFGKVGELTVAEVRPADLPNNDKISPVYGAHLLPLYSFFVVTTTEPQLRGKAIKPDWLKDYVQAHPDELPMTGHGDNAVVTASTEQMQAFIQKHWGENDAWTEEIVFTRADAATKPAAK